MRRECEEVNEQEGQMIDQIRIGKSKREARAFALAELICTWSAHLHTGRRHATSRTFEA